MKILLIAITLFLFSCDGPEDIGPRSATQTSMENPFVVGTLPDGRVIKGFVRDMGDNHDHYIYFVDNTISTNHSVSQGKSSSNQVTVTIDGVIYVPLEKQN